MTEDVFPKGEMAFLAKLNIGKPKHQCGMRTTKKLWRMKKKLIVIKLLWKEYATLVMEQKNVFD